MVISIIIQKWEIMSSSKIFILNINNFFVNEVSIKLYSIACFLNVLFNYIYCIYIYILYHKLHKHGHSQNKCELYI